MNRIKILTLILLLSTILLGAGYAYWSESVTITGTVSTGELKVELIPYDQIDDVMPPYVIINGMPLYSRPSRLPFDISPDKHTLIAGFKDIFPGTFYAVPFRMDNKGSIPAVLKRCSIVYDIDDNGDLLGQLENNLIINHLEMNVYSKDNELKTTIPFIDGLSPVKLVDLESKINSTLAIKKIRLEPGERMQLSSNGDIMGGFISFLFSGGFDNNFENKQFSVKINLDWRQFNDFE